MPRLRTPATQAIADLIAQLRFAPRDRLLTQIDNAERAALDLDDATEYPEGWIIFRVTGYRPDDDQDRRVNGATLRRDLAALIEHLCVAAGLTADDALGALTIEELAARWSVSTKTVDRWRTIGLIGRRVGGLGVGGRVVFTPEAVESFERAHADRVGRAGGFSRIERSGGEARVYRLAVRARSRFGWTLTRCAESIAERTGRSREGVRALLRRLDERSSAPVFAAVRDGESAAQRLALRALERGIEPGDAGERLRLGAAATTANARRARVQRLGDLPPPSVTRAPLGQPEAESLLEPPTVRTGLLPDRPAALPAWLAWARGLPQPDAESERARVLAMHHLRARAYRMPAGRIDTAERDLRWAGLLHRLVLSTQSRVLLQALESAAERPAEAIGEQRLLAGTDTLLAVASHTLVRFDPAHGGRVAGAIGVAASRAALRWADGLPPNRTGGASRRLPESSPAPTDVRSIDAWARALAVPPGLAKHAEALTERDRELLVARHGLTGEPPMDDAGLAQRLGIARGHVARAERRALRALVRVRTGSIRA